MACERFESEVLPAVEAGGMSPAAAHLASCDVCRGRLAEIDRVKARLAARPVRDDGDWEARIWARVAAEGAEPVRRSWRWLAGLALAGGAALAAAAVFVRSPPAPAGFEWSVAAGDQSRLRGTTAHPGDRLTVRGAAGADLHLYREGAPAGRCAEPSPGCRRSADGVEATWTLPSPGRYRVVEIRGARVASGADLDAALAGARAAGGSVRVSAPIEVE